MTRTNLRLPLRKRLDTLIKQLSAASKNAGPGAVEIPNETFDDMAGIIEELEDKVFGSVTPKTE